MKTLMFLTLVCSILLFLSSIHVIHFGNKFVPPVEYVGKRLFIILSIRGAEILDDGSPKQLNIVGWHLIFVGRFCGTFFMSPSGS
jgi:hypothetical protein